MKSKTEFQLKICYKGVFWGLTFSSTLTTSCEKELSGISIPIEASIDLNIANNISAKGSGGFIISKTIVQINYFTFSIYNLSIGDLLGSILCIKNKTLLNLLSFLPKINSATVIMGGFGFEKIKLANPVRKNYDGV